MKKEVISSIVCLLIAVSLSSLAFGENMIEVQKVQLGDNETVVITIDLAAFSAGDSICLRLGSEGTSNKHPMFKNRCFELDGLDVEEHKALIPFVNTENLRTGRYSVYGYLLTEDDNKNDLGDLEFVVQKDLNPSTGRIVSCKTELCDITVKEYSMNEKIYLKSVANIPSDNAQYVLAKPDGSSTEIEMPYSFDADSNGVYTVTTHLEAEFYEPLDLTHTFTVTATVEQEPDTSMIIPIILTLSIIGMLVFVYLYKRHHTE